MYGEPLAETSERVADYRRRTAAVGRKAAFNMSFRPVIAETEGAAWDKARRILSDIRGAPPIVPSSDASGRRLLDIAAKGEIHDERFWTPIAQATGARGNTTCLVGTPEQVADAILKYYRLGIHSFLIRGFDPMADAREYGRELIPRIRAGAEVIDRRAAAE
jgi:alkanesulfonate monooxygenase